MQDLIRHLVLLGLLLNPNLTLLRKVVFRPGSDELVE